MERGEKRAYAESEVEKLRIEVRRYIYDNALHEECQVNVHKKGHWYVFEGSVDSSGTRGGLFLLVPSHEGAKWIIDRLHVGRPCTGYQQ